MFEFDSIVGFAVFALWAYCVFDVIRTPDGTTENLPKLLWLVIVVFIPLIGPLAWLLLGRPRNASFQLRTTAHRQQTYLPPEPPSPPVVRDNDDFQRKREEALRRYHAEREGELKKREEDIRRREEELRKREQGE